MKKSRLAALLGTAGVAAVTLAACGGNSSEGNGSGDGDSKQVLNVTESAEIPSMDSVLATDAASFDVMNNVNEGLYRQGPEGKLVLGMAAEEPEVSEDNLTYTFKIRDDAEWSNGDPVTAGDFVFAWQRLANPKTASEYSYMIDGVVENASDILKGDKEPEELGIKAVDDKTLEIKLQSATPYFKDLLTLSMFLPQNEEYVTEKGNDYASNSDSLLYNGPFIMTNWDGTGLSWSMEKNEDYWDADVVKLDKINVNVVKETSTALNLYETDKIDRMKLTGEYVQTQQDNPDLKSQATSTVAFFKLNQEKNGEETPLANENIRKAISMSFDKEGFAKTILQNGSVPADGIVPEGLAQDPETDKDFREQNGDLLPFDADKAKDYWEKGLDEIGQDSVNLEILGDDTENAKKSGEFMQAQMQTNLPGLTINLTNIPFKARLDKDSKGDYDIQLALWGADYADPMNFLELFETNNSNNTASYSNPEYDALIESADKNASDLEARWSDMQKAEKLLMEEAGVAPIYQRVFAILEKPTVENYVTHPVGAEVSYKWASVKK
ncbi:MAG: peptide ABC transporter substrate-binding protein [Pisciglobus halotolerans]|nr:peptide ABC transporter substrate-binding protein [Pisciglobus halotolerans]